jgi:uncharacterized protein YlxP (DUF503 family)
MARIAAYINEHTHAEVTIKTITAAVQPVLRKEGFAWGVEVSELGVTDLSHQRVLGINSNSTGKFI